VEESTHAEKRNNEAKSRQTGIFFLDGTIVVNLSELFFVEQNIIK
jgi:hypothetical protein